MAGEDLDWLGGRSVCVAIRLETRVCIAGDDVHAANCDPRATAVSVRVWNYLTHALGLADEDCPSVFVSSDAPMASGLASSTSLILGLFGLYAQYLGVGERADAETLMKLAYEFEFETCRGGGMDQMSITMGGVCLTEGRPNDVPELLGSVEFPSEWRAIVIDTGLAKSTAPHIAATRFKQANADSSLDEYMVAACLASDMAWAAIAKRDLNLLSRAIDAAHEAMRDLQSMSTDDLEDLRTLALQSAGLHVKVTGAGGGGSLVGVCTASEAASVAARIHAALDQGWSSVRVLVVEASPLRRQRLADDRLRPISLGPRPHLTWNNPVDWKRE